jgi:hypothetical protein
MATRQRRVRRNAEPTQDELLQIANEAVAIDGDIDAALEVLAEGATRAILRERLVWRDQDDGPSADVTLWEAIAGGERIPVVDRVGIRSLLAPFFLSDDDVDVAPFALSDFRSHPVTYALARRMRTILLHHGAEYYLNSGVATPGRWEPSSRLHPFEMDAKYATDERLDDNQWTQDIFTLEHVTESEQRLLLSSLRGEVVAYVGAIR